MELGARALWGQLSLGVSGDPEIVAEPGPGPRGILGPAGAGVLVSGDSRDCGVELGPDAGILGPWGLGPGRREFWDCGRAGPWGAGILGAVGGIGRGLGFWDCELRGSCCSLGPGPFGQLT